MTLDGAVTPGQLQRGDDRPPVATQAPAACLQFGAPAPLGRIHPPAKSVAPTLPHDLSELAHALQCCAHCGREFAEALRERNLLRRPLLLVAEQPPEHLPRSG